MSKKYVDACATVKRCQEEKTTLLREARDSVEYFEKGKKRLQDAVSAAEVKTDLVSKGQVLLLQYELSRIQHVGNDMNAKYEQLQSMCRPTLPPSGFENTGDNDEGAAGADEEFPEYDDPVQEDADDDSTDSAYASDDGEEDSVEYGKDSS